MFHTWSLEALQLYWWGIISLIGGLFAFMMFIQGGQTLIDKLGKSEIEKSMIINSLGRKWELGFTTLVLFGGALFAAFPLFYATSFGGAYWLWMFILFTFIIQAVSYEYRKKPNNFLGQKTYEIFLKINGYVGIFLIGVALSTWITGASYSLNNMNFVKWQSNLRGLEALFDIRNYFLPLALIFLARITAGMYFLNNINYEDIATRTKKMIKIEMFLFLLFFLAFLIMLLLSGGYVFDPQTKTIKEVSFVYFNNLINYPVLLIFVLLGVLLVLCSFFMIFKNKTRNAIFFIGTGTVLVVTTVLFLLGFNNTAFYPSNFNMQDSLTIRNASGSKYTLGVMAYVSILVPFVLAYIVYAWYAMDKKKIDKDEFNLPNTHNY